MRLSFAYPAWPGQDVSDLPVMMTDGRRIGRIATIDLARDAQQFLVMLDLGRPESATTPIEAISHAIVSAMQGNPLPAGLTRADLDAAYQGPPLKPVSDGRAHDGLSAVAHLVALSLLCATE